MKKLAGRFQGLGWGFDALMVGLALFGLMLVQRKEPWFRLVNPIYWAQRVQGKDLLEARGVLWHGNRALPEIALTFDDGPDPVYTPMVLDALKAANMKATFFLVGEKIRKYPDLVKRMIAEGHEVGCHSYDHQRFNYDAKRGRALTLREQTQQILDANEEMVKLTGQPFKLFRPPYVDWNSDTARASAANNMILVTWSYGGDCYSPKEPPEVFVNRVLRHTQNGSILILHDSHSYYMTAERLPALLAGIQKRGWKPVVLSEMLDHLPHSRSREL